MKKQLRIALCGASGSGKTTLAKELSKMLDLPFIEQSAGLIVSEEMKKRWEDEFGYDASGHANVIKLGNIHNQFGTEFQSEVLRARKDLISSKERFIIDRSPIDNMVYFLLQCGHYAFEWQTMAHLDNAFNGLKMIDGLIYVSYDGIKDVEENGSRIKNLLYQKYTIDPVYDRVIHEFCPKANVPVMEIHHWDFMNRIEQAMDFIAKISAGLKTSVSHY